MPDQFVSPSNRRSKQLRQVQDQCISATASFITVCPRCVSDVRTSDLVCSTCSTKAAAAAATTTAASQVQVEAAAAAAHNNNNIIQAGTQRNNITSDTTTTTKSASVALVLDKDSCEYIHLAASTKPEAVDYEWTHRGKVQDEAVDSDSCCGIFDSCCCIDSKPAASIVEYFEKWLNQPSPAAATTPGVLTSRGCSNNDQQRRQLADIEVPAAAPVVSLTELFRAQAVSRTSTIAPSTAADAKLHAAAEEASVAAAAAKSSTDVETTVAETRDDVPAAALIHCNVPTSRRSPAKLPCTAARRETAQRSRRKKRSSAASSSVPKLQEEKLPEPGISTTVPATAAGAGGLRSAGAAGKSKNLHETVARGPPRAPRRTRVKAEERHATVGGYNGVRTRKGVKGFLVEIRPQKWNKTIWLGTYDTPIEAAAAYDAGVFYTDKPKKKCNFQNFTFCFPPLPSHLDVRSSSPQVRDEVKNFVKRQATFASKLVKAHGNCTRSATTAAPAAAAASHGSASQEHHVQQLGAAMVSPLLQQAAGVQQARGFQQARGRFQANLAANSDQQNARGLQQVGGRFQAELAANSDHQNARIVVKDTVIPESSSSAASAHAVVSAAEAALAAAAYSNSAESAVADLETELGTFLYGTTTAPGVPVQYYNCAGFITPIECYQDQVGIWSPESSWVLSAEPAAAGFVHGASCSEYDIPAAVMINNVNSCQLQLQENFQNNVVAVPTLSCSYSAATTFRNSAAGIRSMAASRTTSTSLVNSSSSSSSSLQQQLMGQDVVTDSSFSITLQNLHQQAPALNITEHAKLEFHNSDIEFFTESSYN